MFENSKTQMEKIADNLYNPNANSKKEKVVSKVETTDADHKAHILATRVGGFGSSDAGMLIDIALTGKVMPKYSYDISKYFLSFSENIVFSFL